MSFSCSQLSSSCLTLEEKPTLLLQAPISPCSLSWLHLLPNIPSSLTSDRLPTLPLIPCGGCPFVLQVFSASWPQDFRGSVLLFSCPGFCLFPPEPLLQWTILVIFPFTFPWFVCFCFFFSLPPTVKCKPYMGSDTDCVHGCIYPQGLELCLAHCKYSGNFYWRSEYTNEGTFPMSGA